MLTPKPEDRKEHAGVDERIVPLVLNPLNTTLFRVSEYRGPELQAANRQLAAFTRQLSSYWKVVVDMPTTHVRLMFPEIIANEVASLLALGGIVGFAAGRPGLAAGMLLSSLACRMISRDPLPREEYADVLEKIGETRLKFLDKFKDPLRTAPNSADALAGHHALRYARLSISALTEKLSTNSAEHRTMMLKLRQALLLLDLSVDPCDYLAPAAIKSLHFEDDLKTLDLLSRMFDTAGDFSLNCFEHDRARFEEDFKRLKAHLDTVQLNHVVQAVAAEPELSPIAPQS